MVIEDVIAVLKDTPPFQFLEPLTLKHVAESVSMEFYPKGTMILRQDGPPSQYLRIIKKGGVKIFVSPEDDNEVVIDFRSEGDIFGFLSLLSGDKSGTNVFAIEDTICYLVSREKVEALIDTNSSVREFFHRSFLNKYLDRTFEEMRSQERT